MFRKLLVPLDQSPLAEQAVGRAVAIARASNAAIDLVLVHHTLPFAAAMGVPGNHARTSAEESYLESIAANLVSVERVPVTHAVLRGEPVEMICRRAFDVGADLVVMTSHGRTGLGRAWLGSVADGVLRHASIPILMLRPIEGLTDHPAERGLFKRILLPLDGSALAMEILAPALALARCADARLLLFQVVPPVPPLTSDTDAPAFGTHDEVATHRLVEDARENLAEAGRRLGEQCPVDFKSQVVVSADIAQAIINAARAADADGIAMSTHGRGASRLLVGSVADKVLNGICLPMLVYRPIAMRAAAAMSSEGFVEQLPSLSGHDVSLKPVTAW